MRWRTPLDRLRLSPLMAATLALLALFDVAGAWALFRVVGPASDAAPETRADWRAPRLERDAGEGPGISRAHPDILGRPVFSKSRRPAVARLQLPGGPAPAMTPNGLRLSALALYAGNRRAFIASPSSPQGQWREIGEQVEGWTITEMLPSSVLLRNADQTFSLSLYPETPGAPLPDGTGRKPPS